ncbi:CCA tRNA nucleotidyltransferase [Sporosarcina sp. ACRSL]|uniref:CCA tRNA nucleotidyltransferase n=1 Tax=Sporosarcina sp. ACRSL TaxID=2918215 RepID=UPI001EF5C70A|nr:CCA tRNA nucleotidyltransferase [Sporosarcina sp. ACRSL]MCG7343050.1 CCA tRNA nucleotidyltransferase [Sporosarcina sp. ACRSL]
MTSEFGTASSRKVVRLLEEAGYEAVFVGGAVRDHLLGKEASDFDIATSAFPGEVKQVFPHTIDVGIAHGTVMVIMDDEPIEVTTYRTESTYTDHRRPDEVNFVRSLKDDLQRRDFTINAIALTLTGELIDPYGGIEDLKNRKIRAVGNASDRFHEDALRMIRAVRFSSVLAFEIESKTFLAIEENAESIKHVSVERIKAEMDKLWRGVNPAKAIAALRETGLSDHLPLFPSYVQLLMDCAPFTTTDQGWSALMLTGHYSASDLAKAYKLSNREKAFLSDVLSAFGRRQTSPFTIDDYYRFTLEVLVATEKVWQAMHPEETGIPVHEMKRMQESLPIRSKDDLKVNGKDLLAWTGQRGGRWVGEWMERIEYAVLHRHCPNDLDKIKEWFFNECKKRKR